jgi:hypothetical protein
VLHVNVDILTAPILFLLDNYDNGIRLTRAAEDTSNLETDSNKGRKRKRKPVSRASSDSSDGMMRCN